MNKINLRQITGILFLSFVIFSMSSSAVQADTIRVPEEYPTIQKAIDVAYDGDTVLVNDGTYQETINFLGKAITVTSVNGPEATILDREVYASPVITFNSGEDSQSIFEGFTVLGHPYVYQKLVSCDFNSSPVIRNNKFLDIEGKAIYCNNSSNPIIENNTISRTVYGIYCENSSSPLIQNNRIVGNINGVYAMYNSSPIITENIISGNALYGVYCYDVPSGGMIITSNTVIGNMYGIHTNNYGTGLASVKNNIVAGNLIGIWGAGSTVHNFNDVWDNRNNYGGCTPGPNDISEDPLFEAYEQNVSTGERIQDAINNIPFLLGGDSPCIGAGEGGVNMGAYPQQGFYGTSGEIIISVNQGVYQEGINLYSYVQLMGEAAETTIIDGEAEETVIKIAGARKTTLSGFTVKNGSEIGISCGEYTIPLITENIITANSQYGIYCDGHSHPDIINNEVVSNGDAGIYVGGSNYPDATIFKNLIADNAGDGIKLFDGVDNTDIANNIIINNAGNGICFYVNSSADIINNVIAFNEADGIYGGWSPYLHLTEILNNIITRNGSYGIESGDDKWPQYLPSDYNDVWGNTFENYGGYAQAGQNDISTDPLFVDSANENFHLQKYSPCIDAGNPADDFSLEPQPNGGRINQGNYGNTPEATVSYICGDANSDRKVSISDVVYLISYLFKGGAAPKYLEAGDANGDGSVTLADIVYLINYLFKQGPPPVCGSEKTLNSSSGNTTMPAPVKSTSTATLE